MLDGVMKSEENYGCRQERDELPTLYLADALCQLAFGLALKDIANGLLSIIFVFLFC